MNEKESPVKVLLTGFDPFGEERQAEHPVNPAWEAVKRVQPPERIELMRLQVPTVFGLSVETVRDAMERFRPDAVICVGQAAGRTAVTPERIGINVMDAVAADNAGNAPQDQPVVPGAPAAYFATLPVKAMTEAIRAADVPAAVSDTAGTFVCNALLYGVLHLAATEFPDTRCGFIHVPCLPEQAAHFSRPVFTLPMEEIVRALEAALRVLTEE